jgi:hypothetical protein
VAETCRIDAEILADFPKAQPSTMDCATLIGPDMNLKIRLSRALRIARPLLSKVAGQTQASDATSSKE